LDGVGIAGGGERGEGRWKGVGEVERGEVWGWMTSSNFGCQMCSKYHTF